MCIVYLQVYACLIDLLLESIGCEKTIKQGGK